MCWEDSKTSTRSAATPRFALAIAGSAGEMKSSRFFSPCPPICRKAERCRAGRRSCISFSFSELGSISQLTGRHRKGQHHPLATHGGRTLRRRRAADRSALRAPLGVHDDRHHFGHGARVRRAHRVRCALLDDTEGTPPARRRNKSGERLRRPPSRLLGLSIEGRSNSSPLSKRISFPRPCRTDPSKRSCVSR